jgi:ubiquitin-protein ligase
MNARLRRLLSDYERVRTEFAGHKYIVVEPISGQPPEKYRVTYRLPGLRWDNLHDRPIIVSEHTAEIVLQQDYPREKPQSHMLTEIWHPNFGPFICIGDHWAAGESLADVIIQIGDMIQYKTYNVKSPLNGLAARWAQENSAYLPVGHIDLYQAEPEIILDDWANAEDIKQTESDALLAQHDDLEIELR